jgi:L-ascorbate metabolism protein UlaG (beta-lactamase superfamily)
MTHGHFDHVGDVPALVKTHDPVVVGNYDLCTVMQQRCGGGRFEGMNTGGTTEFDGIRVTLTRAYHSSGVDSPEGPVYGGMPNGVVVAAPGVAVLYHAGDTDVFSDMALIARLFEPKVCILPIGDRFTMGAKGAAMAAELLNPVAIIPCHYKTFPLLAQSADPFRTALPEHLRKRLHVLEVGQAIAWTASGVG